MYFQDRSLAMLDAQRWKRWKAVENQMLGDRACEELVRLNDEIRAIVEHYSVMNYQMFSSTFLLSICPEVC
jgi:hypothetical protein